MKGKNMSTELTLVHYKPLQEGLPPLYSSSLRRCFADRFPHECFHNHTPDGRSRYRGAPVQFKVINDEVFLMGINEGAAFLTAFQWPQTMEVPIGKTDQIAVLQFIGKRMTPATFSEIEPQAYRSLSPYLPLNQDAFKAFQEKSDPERRALVERKLCEHILSAAKWCGVWVKHRIDVSLIQMRLRPSIRVKSNLAFLGMDVLFETNTAIPDFMGIGRFVSRGYGTLARYG